MSDPVPNVYACIAAVSAEIAQTGISKSRKNAQQGYSFRGIDEVFNALAPLLAKHKLVILPRILTRECVERVSKSGAMQFFVVVEAEFDYVSAHDGSKHIVRTIGEAQDMADKATNKAMSAAYKYAAFQTFCIPTEGDNDADATTPEETVGTAKKPVALGPPLPPPGYGPWLHDYLACADTGLDPLRKMFKDSKPIYREYLTKHDGANYEFAVKTAEAATKAAKAREAVPA
jgi:hypothetical protein